MDDPNCNATGYPTTTHSPLASPAAGSSTSSQSRCPATLFPSCRPSPTTSPGNVRPPSPPLSPIPTRVGSGAGWSWGRTQSTGRWDLSAPTTPSPTTPGVFSPRAAPPCLSYGPDGQRQEAGMEVFVASHAPRPRMLIFGAIDFASALARQGAFLGYRVTVCDARPVFATRPVSPTPTRSSSIGPTATSPRRPSRARSTRGPRSAC